MEVYPAWYFTDIPYEAFFYIQEFSQLYLSQHAPVCIIIEVENRQHKYLFLDLYVCFQKNNRILLFTEHIYLWHPSMCIVC